MGELTAAGVASPGAPSPDLTTTLWCLYLDRVAAEVTARLDAEGVRSILLKGPTTAAWLYADGDVRPYGDVDLLVDPAQWPTALAAVEDLGFRDARPGEHPSEQPSHAILLVRPDGARVDLHRTIPGVGVSHAQAWTVLAGHQVSERIGGRDLRILDEPTRLLHLALHAAQHGATKRQPIEDLERAATSVAEPAWRQAAQVAADVDAIDEMGIGLRLTPAGDGVARTLGLPQGGSLAALLRRDQGGTASALRVEAIVNAADARSAVTTAVRWVFPSAAKMRRISPLARSGRFGLALAYCQHLIRAPKAIPALVQWFRARRLAKPR